MTTPPSPASPPSPRELVGPDYVTPPPAGKELIGTTPSEWQATDWINSKPLTLQSLRGKVVLVRWWTAPACPYCKASAPALQEFAGSYADKGLVVVGMYHHKSETRLDPGDVAKYAERYGFQFPVAIDPDWKTLRRWWLTDPTQGWTSVTFLIGRDGTIRYIHPGGAFFKGEPSYDALKQAIEAALAAR